MPRSRGLRGRRSTTGPWATEDFGGGGCGAWALPLRHPPRNTTKYFSLASQSFSPRLPVMSAKRRGPTRVCAHTHTHAVTHTCSHTHAHTDTHTLFSPSCLLLNHTHLPVCHQGLGMAALQPRALYIPVTLGGSGGTRGGGERQVCPPLQGPWDRRFGHSLSLAVAAVSQASPGMVLWDTGGLRGDQAPAETVPASLDQGTRRALRAPQALRPMAAVASVLGGRSSCPRRASCHTDDSALALRPCRGH